MMAGRKGMVGPDRRARTASGVPRGSPRRQPRSPGRRPHHPPRPNARAPFADHSRRSPAMPRAKPSAKSFTARFSRRDGTAARPPICSASATRRCSTRLRKPIWIERRDGRGRRLPDDPRALPPEVFDFVVNNELKRAIRSQNFLTLLVVEPTPRTAEGQRPDLARELARVVGRVVRETDILSPGRRRPALACAARCRFRQLDAGRRSADDLGRAL